MLNKYCLYIGNFRNEMRMFNINSALTRQLTGNTSEDLFQIFIGNISSEMRKYFLPLLVQDWQNLNTLNMKQYLTPKFQVLTKILQIQTIIDLILF